MNLAEQPRDDVTDVAARPLPRAPERPAQAPRPLPLVPTGTPPGPPPAGTVLPSIGFLCSHPAHWLGLGFGSGLSPTAPGTVGTLWAWLAWTVLAHWLSPAQLGGLLLASLPVAWWASTVTARHLRMADPGNIVIDEIVAFWAVLWLVLPAGFWMQLTAFVLFRFFDAAKPGPVGWADRLFHGHGGWRGGLGILLDDLVAAFCTLLVIAVLSAW